MSNLDVSLTLKLIKDQFGANAKDAAKDLNDVKKAAEDLGKAGGGSGGSKLGEDIKKTSEAAKQAARELGNVDRAVQAAQKRLGEKYDLDAWNRRKQAFIDSGQALQGVSDKAKTAKTSMIDMWAAADGAERAARMIGKVTAAIGGAIDKSAEFQKKLYDIAEAGDALGNRKALQDWMLKASREGNTPIADVQTMARAIAKKAALNISASSATAPAPSSPDSPMCREPTPPISAN